jgi:hypothetical protein
MSTSSKVRRRRRRRRWNIIVDDDDDDDDNKNDKHNNNDDDDDDDNEAYYWEKINNQRLTFFPLRLNNSDIYKRRKAKRLRTMSGGGDVKNQRLIKNINMLDVEIQRQSRIYNDLIKVLNVNDEKVLLPSLPSMRDRSSSSTSSSSSSSSQFPSSSYVSSTRFFKKDIKSIRKLSRWTKFIKLFYKYTILLSRIQLLVKFINYNTMKRILIFTKHAIESSINWFLVFISSSSSQLSLSETSSSSSSPSASSYSSSSSITNCSSDGGGGGVGDGYDGSGDGNHRHKYYNHTVLLAQKIQ